MNSKIRYLTEGALAAALTLILAELKLWQMPQGGSVTLESLPIILFALRWGLSKGLAIGALSGLMTLLLGGFLFHPLQAALDYPLAYGILGLAALAPGRPRLGTLMAMGGRLACHVLSGAIFFGSYAPEGTSPLLYSLVYNGGYMACNALLALILVPLVVPRLPVKRGC